MKICIGHNKTFRYRISSICFLIGIVASFFTSFFAVTNAREIDYAINEINTYRYRNSLQYDISFIDEVQLPYYEYGNCILSGVTVSLDGANKVILSDIVFYANEALEYPIHEGYWPTEKDFSLKKNVAVVGYEYKKYAENIEGQDYLWINGQLYYICGYTKGEKSREYDTCIILFYDAIGNNVKKQLNDKENNLHFIVNYVSNEHNFENVEDELQDELSKNALVMKLVGDRNEYSQVFIYKESAYLWIFFYCLVVCILISGYWIYERKKEISIRRAFGYSMSQVCILLLRDFLKLLMIGNFIAILLVALFRNTLSQGLIKIDYFIKDLLVTSSLSVVVPLVSLIVPIVIIKYKMPIGDMNKKE